MVNTNMFEFKHPKYYKELRSIRNKLDQVISKQQATASSERSPGPGLKPQASSDSQVVNQVKLSSQSQAPSDKQQASSAKLRKLQAASSKRQA